MGAHDDQGMLHALNPDRTTNIDAPATLCGKDDGFVTSGDIVGIECAECRLALAEKAEAEDCGGCRYPKDVCPKNGCLRGTDDVFVHTATPGTGGPLCGVAGYVGTSPTSTTCPACKRAYGMRLLNPYGLRSLGEFGLRPPGPIPPPTSDHAMPKSTRLVIRLDVPKPTWWQRRKFDRAYMTLRRVADRHKEAQHDVEFIAVNEARIVLICHTCDDSGERP